MAILILAIAGPTSAGEAVGLDEPRALEIDVPVVVDAEGRVSAVSLPSELKPVVAARLREHIRGWSFEPARIEGRKVESRTHLAISMRIEPLAGGDFALHVIEVGSGPKVLERTGLRYPEQALERRIQGTVLVRMTVSPDGSVGNVRADAATQASSSLVRAAVRGVRRWRFARSGRWCADRQRDCRAHSLLHRAPRATLFASLAR